MTLSLASCEVQKDTGILSGSGGLGEGGQRAHLCLEIVTQSTHRLLWWPQCCVTSMRPLVHTAARCFIEKCF